jgi:hypothetical protein
MQISSVIDLENGVNYFNRIPTYSFYVDGLFLIHWHKKPFLSYHVPAFTVNNMIYHLFFFILLCLSLSLSLSL